MSICLKSTILTISKDRQQISEKYINHLPYPDILLGVILMKRSKTDTRMFEDIPGVTSAGKKWKKTDKWREFVR